MDPVVVVGGGIVGTSVAYHLREADVPVVLYERDALGSGATADSVAMFVRKAAPVGPAAPDGAAHRLIGTAVVFYRCSPIPPGRTPVNRYNRPYQGPLLRDLRTARPRGVGRVLPHRRALPGRERRATRPAPGRGGAARRRRRTRRRGVVPAVGRGPVRALPPGADRRARRDGLGGGPDHHARRSSVRRRDGTRGVRRRDRDERARGDARPRRRRTPRVGRRDGPHPRRRVPGVPLALASRVSEYRSRSPVRRAGIGIPWTAENRGDRRVAWGPRHWTSPS